MKQTTTIGAALAAAIMRLAKRSDISIAARDLEPGEHKVDETVQIRALLKKGEAYESVVATAIPWQRLATYLLIRVNRAMVANAVEAVIKEEADTKELRQDVKAALEILKGRSVRNCAGKLSGQADVGYTSNS